MRVVVVLHAQAAQERLSPTRGSATESLVAGAQELQSAEEELGISLKPMYPGQSHPTLAPFYFIDVPDQTTAEKVIARLTQSAWVDAAYLQPDAELPG
jgi:hypothetical protein